MTPALLLWISWMYLLLDGSLGFQIAKDGSFRTSISDQNFEDDDHDLEFEGGESSANQQSSYIYTGLYTPPGAPAPSFNVDFDQNVPSSIWQPSVQYPPVNAESPSSAPSGAAVESVQGKEVGQPTIQYPPVNAESPSSAPSGTAVWYVQDNRVRRPTIQYPPVNVQSPSSAVSLGQGNEIWQPTIQYPPVQDNQVRQPTIQYPPVQDNQVRQPTIQYPPVQDNQVRQPTIQYPPVQDNQVRQPTIQYPPVQDNQVRQPTIQYPPVQDNQVRQPTIQYPPVQDNQVRQPTIQYPPVQDNQVRQPTIQYPPVQDNQVRQPTIQYPPVQDNQVRQPTIQYPPVQDNQVRQPTIQYPPVQDNQVRQPTIQYPPVNARPQSPPVAFVQGNEFDRSSRYASPQNGPSPQRPVTRQRSKGWLDFVFSNSFEDEDFDNMDFQPDNSVMDMETETIWVPAIAEEPLPLPQKPKTYIVHSKNGYKRGRVVHTKTFYSNDYKKPKIIEKVKSSKQKF